MKYKLPPGYWVKHRELEPKEPEGFLKALIDYEEWCESLLGIESTPQSQRTTFGYALMKGNLALAFCTMERCPEQGRKIKFLWVPEEHRRKGHGRRLMEYIVWQEESRVSLSSYPKTAGFYKKLGFREIPPYRTDIEEFLGIGLYRLEYRPQSASNEADI